MNKKSINTIFKCVGLAMGVATVVLSIMKTVDTNTAITLLGIGVTSIGVSQLSSEN